MAEKNKYRFKGHETFVLREGWLNKGLSETAENERVFSENYGADALGVGPNMAKAIRYWLKTADLVEDSARAGVRLSDMGSLILEFDPYIEDMFTLWLVHCRIASNIRQATAWNLFFNRFSYEEFDKSQMYEEMKELAEELLEGEPVAEKSVEGDCDAILHMYLPKAAKENNPEEKNVSPFGKLGLLRESSGVISRKQPDLNRLPEEIVLYLMAEQSRGKTSVYFEDLLELSDGPGRLLFLRRTALMELLERLEAKGHVIINRTAGLNMVYWEKSWSGLEIAETYYRKNKK